MIYQNQTIIKVGRETPLSISWELVTHCQFSCSYCYFNPYESDINYSEVMKMVFLKLKNVEEPVEIILLGGEPTLHPDFYEIIKTLYLMDQVKKIEVITNFQPPAEFWTPLIPYKNKMELSLSYHVEYSQNNFFNKIEKIKDHFLINIIFLVHNQLVFLPKMRTAADTYFELGLDFIPITFAKLIDRTKDEIRYLDYQPETLDFFKEQEERVKQLKQSERIPVETESGNKLEIDQLEFGSKDLNRFKGWQCHNSALVIHPDGVVSYPCTNVKKHILFAELKKRVLKCAHEICPCEAYWKFSKTNKL